MIQLYYLWLCQAIINYKPPFRYVKKWFGRGGKGKDFKIAAFDTETIGLGGDVNFATFMTEDEDVAHCCRGRNIIARMFKHMANFPDYIWFAHNAQYDWRYVLDYLLGTDLRVEFSLRNDNSIFAVTVWLDDETKLVMRDSYAIWPHSLRKLADAFCPELPKGDVDFTRETFDPHKRSHVAYAKRDVEILVRGLRRYNDIVREKYGVNLSSTVASTALRAWEFMLDKETFFHNPVKHEPFIRSAYFGGLVFLTRNDCIEGNIRTYDRNSSYPADMRDKGVPYGTIYSTRRFNTERPGIYDVTVGTPDDLRVPIIPKRIIRGAAQSVIWPRGIFRTSITSVELQFALDHGYRLFDIHDGRVWEKIIFPFTDFVDKAELIRQIFKGRTEETVAKLIQNSLYGKMCAKRERRSLHAAKDLETVDGLEPWDETGNYYVKTEYADDLCVLPQWGVWITANARVSLLRQVYDVLGPDAVIYGDTDSITTLGELPVGKAYGEWKLEKTWSKFRAIAPKVYAGQLDDGTWAGAAKGIPAKKSGQEIFRELYETGLTRVKIDTLPSLMVTMKRGEGKVRTIFRRSTDIGNSANWEEAQGGIVLPRRAAG